MVQSVKNQPTKANPSKASIVILWVYDMFPTPKNPPDTPGIPTDPVASVWATGPTWRTWEFGDEDETHTCSMYMDVYGIFTYQDPPFGW